MVFTTSAYAIGRAEKTVYVQADEVAADENSIDTSGAGETGQDIAYAVEGGAIDESDGVPDVDKEYADCGITADPHTACWLYQGKRVAVFYDKDKFLSTNDVPENNAVYLEVCRDKKGRIEEIRKIARKKCRNS